MSWAQELPRHSRLVFHHCWVNINVFTMSLLGMLLLGHEHSGGHRAYMACRVSSRSCRSQSPANTLLQRKVTAVKLRGWFKAGLRSATSSTRIFHSEGVQDQVGWSPGQPDLVLDLAVGNSTCGSLVFLYLSSLTKVRFSYQRLLSFFKKSVLYTDTGFSLFNYEVNMVKNGILR